MKERSVDLWLCANMSGLLGFSRIQRFVSRDPGCCCRITFCTSLHLGSSGFAAVTPSQQVFACGCTDAGFPATVSEQPIKDAVITVPAYFNQAERRAVLHAARMADLKVLQLINDNTAVALNYGVFRRKDINATAQVGAFGRCGEFCQVTCMQGRKCCRKNPKNLKWTLLVSQSPLFSCVHQQDKEIKPCVHVLKPESFWNEGRCWEFPFCKPVFVPCPSTGENNSSDYLKYWNTNSEVFDFPEAEERAKLWVLNCEIV